MTTWVQHVENWVNCDRCLLSRQRGRICLARACKSQDASGAYGGGVRCDVMFCGEAPGSSEDAVGLPFVGPAGDLLDNIRQRALPRDVRCTFTNLVACYPREAKESRDHRPKPDEILTCRPRLIEFINIAQPRLIVRVGDTAERYLDFCSTTPFIDIVHPAYILSRLPLAQKRFEVDKCVVKINNAYERVIQNSQPFTPWSTEDAESESRSASRRQQLRQVYGEAGYHSPREDTFKE